MRFYGTFQKIDAEERMVWGYASTEAKDRHGEIVLKSAIEDALADYLEYANIREMHQLSAVGTAEEAQVDDKGLYVGAKVVDDVAWGKVTSGVYKGFSIGGKVLARDADDKKIITKIRLDEISLVDRPSNPEARFDVWKAAGAPQEDDMAKKKPAAVAIPTGAKSDVIAKTVNDAVAVGAPVIVATEADGDLLKAINDKVEIVIKAAAELPLDPPAPEAAGEAVDAASAGVVEGEGTVAKADGAKPEADGDAADADTAAKAADGAAADPAAEPADGAADPVTKATAALDKIDAAVATVVTADGLEKSMYHVGRFAELLESLSYLAMGAQSEADFEGDNSPVPAKLRDWLKAGSAIFKDMAREEVDEFVAQFKAQKAAKGGEITVDINAVGGETLAKAVEDAKVALQAERDDLQKALTASQDALAKLADRIEPLAKTVEDLVATNTDLAKRLAAVEDQPAPAKTAGTFAVGKEQDAGGASALEKSEPSADELQSALAAMPAEDRALLLTKAALAMPRPAHFVAGRP